ncbi:hypothetical protein Tco_0682596 [Tanacetum coccineum]|uniref:Uncharacterized protein n=1 Tax=Tanacetum coccineum TaxID=301880 RepID=A0ABQ4XSJ0_9ASTR
MAFHTHKVDQSREADMADRDNYGLLSHWRRERVELEVGDRCGKWITHNIEYTLIGRTHVVHRDGATVEVTGDRDGGMGVLNCVSLLSIWVEDMDEDMETMTEVEIKEIVTDEEGEDISKSHGGFCDIELDFSLECILSSTYSGGDMDIVLGDSCERDSSTHMRDGVVGVGLGGFRRWGKWGKGEEGLYGLRKGVWEGWGRG